MATIILRSIDNLILYCQISSYYFVSQPSDTTKNVANCIKNQSMFEKNAKKILGHKYATHKKNFLLTV